MRALCLYFQVHQPYRLKPFRFFDIGKDHHYYDTSLNKSVMQEVAQNAYLPMNLMLYKLINSYGNKLKLCFSITGLALDQFEEYAPEVLSSFRMLANTGQVEFLSETYSHSLVSLNDFSEFERQVQLHRNKIQKHFNQTPNCFRNTELIYSDHIGEMVAKMGFSAMMTGGAKHILGDRSPNHLYQHHNRSDLQLLLQNNRLSNDIALNISDAEKHSLSPKKYLRWLKDLPADDDLVNLFMDYEALGKCHKEDKSTVSFMKHLISRVIEDGEYVFTTPTELLTQVKSKGKLQAADPISRAVEVQDTSPWIGNVLQKEAYSKLYELLPKVQYFQNQENIQADWLQLQASDHFYYMNDKQQPPKCKDNSPYSTPYDAFINYMNVLEDFTIRIDALLPEAAPDTTVPSEQQLKAAKMKIEDLAYLKLYALRPLITTLSPTDLAVIWLNAPSYIREKIDKFLSKAKYNFVRDYANYNDIQPKKLIKALNAAKTLLNAIYKQKKNNK